MSPFSTGRALLNAQSILTKAGLSTGMVYADFGAGTLGHFVFPASKIVGDKGKVFAVDILQKALEGIESTARLFQATNIVSVWGDIERQNGVGISDVSVDLVSIVNITSLIAKTLNPIKEAHRVLKPSGKLLLVGWDPASNLGPSAQEKHSAQEIIKLVETSGDFTLLEKFVAGSYHWGAVFVRR